MSNDAGMIAAVRHSSFVIRHSVRSVTVTAPSRLHFGLYGFGQAAVRQFGGIGAMVELPCLRLTVRPDDAFSVRGPLCDRVQEFAARWTAFYRSTNLPTLKSLDLPRAAIAVVEAPPEHSGLGVGTQLGLSVAAALNALHEIPPVTPAELAQSVGRAKRSAVGTYGFVYGGLIAERGKLPGENISPLDARVALPTDWRFVLVMPRVAAGLAGHAEVQAFQQLPSVPQATTDELTCLAREELLPSASLIDFKQFSAALDRYCHLAGLCFATVQGGAYNGPVLTHLVEMMRSCGAVGVGQSSWGPTLFAVLPTEDAAKDFDSRLRRKAGDLELETIITAPNNHGASIDA
jgi:beta-RFAP synthase